MSFFKCHKNYVEKSLNMFGLSTYQGFWISFIKGLLAFKSNFKYQSSRRSSENIHPRKED